MGGPDPHSCSHRSMTRCGFGPNATGGTVDEPWGHTLVGGALMAMNIDNPPALGPAGGALLTRTWLSFLREHLGGAIGARRCSA